MPITYESFLALAKERDLFSALDHVQKQAAPLDAAAIYHQFVVDSYWKHKNIPLLIAVAPEGIAFCVKQSQLAPNDTLRNELLGAAKKLAYNLASFTWPGWNEPGITLSANAIDIGRGAALLNLDLAEKLNRPPEKIRDAHWLIGAHLLWAKDYLAAITYFERSIPAAAPAADPRRLLFEGYLLLARSLNGDPQAPAQWQTLLSTLESQNTSEAQFSLNQLKTAYVVYQARR